MPVAGRWGTKSSELERRLSARGVTGEPDAACPRLGSRLWNLLVPGENMFFNLAD